MAFALAFDRVYDIRLKFIERSTELLQMSAKLLQSYQTDDLLPETDVARESFKHEWVSYQPHST